MLLGGAVGLTNSYQRNRKQPNQREEGTETDTLTERGVQTAEKRRIYFWGEQKQTYRSLEREDWSLVNITEAEVQFRMKILLIFTLYLISGPVSCFDVIGYPGGSVMIYCNNKHHRKNNRYFCNTNTKQCVYSKSNQTQNTWIHEDRFSLHDYLGGLIVTYRNLSLQDAGSYQCGETGVWKQTVNLKVNSDPCCLGSKTVSGYLGETVTISCSYPEQFERNTKFFFKQNHRHFAEKIRNSETQRDRFSISDDRSSNVLSVKIRDVREDDGGVYFCGVSDGGQRFSYYSFYSETQLQVTAPGSSVIIMIIITVCVCVGLLLTGALALIFYKLRG
ncbi:hypothetical protein SRHO_G00177700 [Serrasalmus rhombeus]